MSNRGEAAIMITFNSDSVDEIKEGRITKEARMAMSFSDDLDEEDSRRAIMGLGVVIMSQDAGEIATEDSAS